MTVGILETRQRYEDSKARGLLGIAMNRVLIAVIVGILGQLLGLWSFVTTQRYIKKTLQTKPMNGEITLVSCKLCCYL